MTTTTPTPTSGPAPASTRRTGAPQAEGPLRPAALPTGAGTVGWLGPVLALLLLGVAAVLAQDAWTRLRDGSGTASTWLGSVISGLDGLAPSSAVAAAAALAAVLGLLLVLAAFSRRTRRALVLRGDLGAHLTTRDVARLAAGAARQVDGVLEASAAATRRKVTVEVTTTGDDATRSDVQREVERALSALSSAPRVTTTAKEANR